MRALLAVLGVFFAAMLVFFPKWTVDDAYITFRYAHNLASHGELTWNIGQSPIEGYTGVLLPAALAGLESLGLNPPLSSEVIGVLCFALCGIWLYLICRHFGVKPGLTLTVVAVFVSAPFLWTNALSGLETLLFAWLVLAGMYGMVRWMSTDSPTAYSTSVVLCTLLACGLARPEGVILGGLGLFVMFLIARRRQSAGRFTLVAALAYLLPASAYFIWRWQYYGLLLPNTFYAKMHGLAAERNLLAFLPFVAVAWAIPLSAAVVAVKAGRVPIVQRIRDAMCTSNGRSLIAAGCIGFIFTIAVAIQYSQASLVMNFSHRYMAPFYGLGLIGIAVVIDWGMEGLRQSQPGTSSRPKTALYVLAGLLVCQFGIHVVGFPSEIAFVRRYHKMLQDEHIAVGKYLAATVPPQTRLIVMYDAGAIPYFSGLPTVDFGLLNDPYLTRRGLTVADQIDYFYSHRAGAVVMRTRDTLGVELDSLQRLITQDVRFGDYTLEKVFTSRVAPTYSQALFIHRDLRDGRGTLSSN
ncbi:MAG: hypothetical protein HY851_05375 [candidate division Zixibacteria bacterium]|nr:hypothetical protein [candidate division Zixibacteria bacterium]